jgi:hypothetical protein
VSGVVEEAVDRIAEWRGATRVAVRKAEGADSTDHVEPRLTTSRGLGGMWSMWSLKTTDYQKGTRALIGPASLIRDSFVLSV